MRKLLITFILVLLFNTFALASFTDNLTLVKDDVEKVNLQRSTYLDLAAFLGIDFLRETSFADAHESGCLASYNCFNVFDIHDEVKSESQFVNVFPVSTVGSFNEIWAGLGSLQAEVDKVAKSVASSGLPAGPGALTLVFAAVLSYLTWFASRYIVWGTVRGVVFGVDRVKQASVLLRVYSSRITSMNRTTIIFGSFESSDDVLYGRHSIAVSFTGLLKRIASSADYLVDGFRFSLFDIIVNRFILAHRY